MQHEVLSKNSSILKIGNLKFFLEDGKLLIQALHEQFPYPLSACDTLALLNLLSDFKLDIITVAHVEQRDRERKNKKRQGHKKPKMIQVDGQCVEGVELSALEKEQND
jgi:hypothetical protein